MSSPSNLPKDRLLAKFTLMFFKRRLLTVALWLVLIVFGALSYGVFLKHQGFPSINIPLAIVNGSYAVNDAAAVDSQVAGPISAVALKQPGVKSVSSNSQGNFFSVVAQYKESINAHEAAKSLQRAVDEQLKLPAGAKVSYDVPYFGVTGGDSKKIDALLSLYAVDGAKQPSTQQLAQQAKLAADYLNAHKPSLVKTFFVQSPFQTVTDPATGQSLSLQRSFDRYGLRQGSVNHFYGAVNIAVTAKDGADVLKLDDQLKTALADLNGQYAQKGYHTVVSASTGPSIHEELSELQRVLLEGLVAVLVVGSIVIALRASFITVLSMLTVIFTTLGLLYLIGYTLNVITLFALILGLSLIVDDTIIMVEAIDARRRKQATAREAVRVAVTKISRAMVAATLTAALSFAPLLFVGGILGSFIHAIPVTIISALIVSLLVALIFIPMFARSLLLGKKQLGERGVREFAAGFEAKVAHAICRPMLWARGSGKKLLSVGLLAIILGVVAIGAAGFVFSKVTFNIFPPSKDSNALSVSLQFPAGTTVQAAEDIAANADQLTSKVLGKYFVDASYYGSGSASSATMYVNITPYSQRSVPAPQLVKRLQTAFDDQFKEANAKVGQVDVGPPAGAFTVLIKADDRTNALKLAADVANYLKTAQLTRVSGTHAHFKNVDIADPDTYTRQDGKLNVEVDANFDSTDTTTLVTLAQDAVKKQFPQSKMTDYGLAKDAIQFNLGEESDNQDSFKSLALAFPIMLLVVFVLLAIEFRSLLQPVLIFLAIPFSLLGVTLGLYLTDNAFSFFAAMGFFALVGLSLKNTILLTDYANQARRSGMGAIDSAVAALEERFRPLVATSLTAVVSLIPLALTSPFWQGLAVVLIGGLLSTTTMVILVFPYYYLGGEFLRGATRRAVRRLFRRR